MPHSSSGGLGPARGTGLESRVLAWLAAHMLARQALSDRWAPDGGVIAAIGGQTARPLDDIGVLTAGGGHLLIQAKTRLERGRAETSELAKAIRQVVEQYLQGIPADPEDGSVLRSVDPARDRLMIVTDPSAPAPMREGLIVAAEALSELPDALPFTDVGNSESVVVGRTILLEHVRREWEAACGTRPADSDLRGLFRVLRFLVLDLRDDGVDQGRAVQLLGQVMLDERSAIGAWRALGARCHELAERKHWMREERLRQKLGADGLALAPSRLSAACPPTDRSRPSVDPLESRASHLGLRPAPGGNERIIAGSVSAPMGHLPQHLRGREAEVEALASTAGGRRVKVLKGMGGVGKSALALRHAARCREDGAEVFWVSATSKERLNNSLRQVALAVGVPPGVVEDLWREPGREAADTLWQHLESWEREWLLVLDNSDDLDVLACQDTALKDMTGWVRAPVGRSIGVVVTTRDRISSVWSAAQSQIIEVEPLEHDAGAAVLLDLAPGAGPHEAAQELADALGGLPLGLVLAGSYLATTADDPLAHARSFVDYRRLISSSPAVLDGAARMHTGDARDDDSKARETVLRTWELSLALLERRGLGSARQLLQILSCFAPSTPLPARLVSPETIAAEWGEQVLSDAAAADLLRGLHRVGLLNVAKTENGPEYELHRLVAEVSVRPLVDEPHEHSLSWHVALGMLCAASPNEARDPAAWPTWQSIAPHWLQILARFPLPSADVLLGGCLVQSYLRSRGDLASAHEASERLTAIVETFDPPDDLRHTMRYHNALTSRDLGDLALAESEMRAVAQFHTAAGEDSSELAVAARGELGTILRLRGKPTESEKTLREVLAAQRAIYGPRSREVLLTRHDLTITLRALARYEEATAEIAELCKEFELAFGPEHVDTLACLHEHAVALRDMHDLDAALSVFRRVYRTECAVLGDQHPSALTTRNSIAITLRLQGHNAAAGEELRAVLEARTRLLGANHPDTLNTRRELVAVGVGAGALSYGEAEDELRDILSADGVQLAREHPTIVAALADLGAVQTAQGRERVALETLQTALDAAAREWGYSHPQTLLIRVQLADLFTDAGMHAQALAEYRGALTGQRSAVGQLHIESLNIEVRIAACHLKAGMAHEAFDAFRDAAARFAHRYGPSHPETLVALVGAATAQLLLGRRDEAIELLERVLAQQLIAEGRASEQVRETRNNLAVALRMAGRHEESLAHYDEALASVLPSEATSLTAQELRHNRATTLRHMGRLGDAENEYRALLEIQIEQSGPRGPRVLDTRHGIARLLADAGEWEQAEAEYTEVLNLRREVLGPTHLASLTTQGCLAALMNDTGRPAEAQKLYEHALSSLTTTVGQDHPEALRTMHNLAWAFQHQGKFRQAEEMFRRTAARRRRVLGAADEETLTTEFELANCLRRQRRSAEAIGSMRKNLETAVAAHGVASNLALRARHEFAAALMETHQRAEALEEIEKSRRIADEVLPVGHPLRRSIAASYTAIVNPPQGPSRHTAFHKTLPSPGSLPNSGV